MGLHAVEGPLALTFQPMVAVSTHSTSAIQLPPRAVTWVEAPPCFHFSSAPTISSTRHTR
jgi:hypothetical protein